jgi:hypothetical protein
MSLILVLALGGALLPAAPAAADGTIYAVISLTNNTNQTIQIPFSGAHTPQLTEWGRAEESNETLLRGPLLIEAQKWFDQRSQDLSDQERKFVSASRALRERQWRRRAFAVAGSMTVVSTLLVLLFFMWRRANDQRVAAQEQARIAETRRLDAQASEKKANDARADRLNKFMLVDLRDKLIPIGRLNILDDVVKEVQDYLQHLPKISSPTPGCACKRLRSTTLATS